MDTLSKKELAEAKKLARRLRIRRIRRRIATGAAVVVATFSGIVLYRSVEAQTVSTTTTAAVTQTVSDDGWNEGEESGDDGTLTVVPSTPSTVTPTTVTPSTSSAPLTTSQS